MAPRFGPILRRNCRSLKARRLMSLSAEVSQKKCEQFKNGHVEIEIAAEKNTLFSIVREI
jgi:hypothetical protein